ncbi:MAG: hypothetical protein AVDCRST_MAG49-4376, partial [uncultured Thermomicrobiales bacterium]
AATRRSRARADGLSGDRRGHHAAGAMAETAGRGAPALLHQPGVPTLRPGGGTDGSATLRAGRRRGDRAGAIPAVDRRSRGVVPRPERLLSGPDERCRRGGVRRRGPARRRAVRRGWRRRIPGAGPGAVGTAGVDRRV